MKIGKHERIDIANIQKAIPGNCFHGEVWVKCPYCNRAIELMGKTSIKEKDRYRIYQCECGELFKDFIG